ncbi:protein CLEC16A-like isoform X2 [Corticium candelabrum]|uniref:protein CLEC16A-like isoform X2 n=1 Tax=Corticium candelabrum TaxID=121492 RepID=UPI002E31DFC7|nr:protein CLEC16A-like isoform X2 [Corticium candelabrum]
MSSALQRSRQWLSEVLWKPKNPFSLDHLKYLHTVLGRNSVVTERNKSLLVESIRSVAEILIWGDQNDAKVFDFFLEKNMFRAFLKILQQRTNRYVPVQMLQTLNILFENIRNETSIYYLLSNNHVNAFIVHRYDFSDEEVMAYYISFLKTLSLKLNKHTIHFFFNEHLRDFPLYTEAIKFFNHSESMVRIAVRTITLNVYKVGDESTLSFICNRTAVPYFSNLVWFIGKHVLELDNCVKTDADHLRYHQLSELVAEHLDQLHYLNDILCLNIQSLNEVLTDHLLDRLLIPLYIYSLTVDNKAGGTTEDRPSLTRMLALFLLSQVFLILSYSPLVSSAADVILNGDTALCEPQAAELETHGKCGSMGSIRAFVAPPEPLADTLMASTLSYVPAILPAKQPDQTSPITSKRRVGNLPRQSTHSPDYFVIHSESESEIVQDHDHESDKPPEPEYEANSTFYIGKYAGPLGAVDCEVSDEASAAELANVHSVANDPLGLSNSSAMEGVEIDVSESFSPPDLVTSTLVTHSSTAKNLSSIAAVEHPNDRAYMTAVLNALSFNESDLEPLFALCLMYALVTNKGVDKELLGKTHLIPSVVTGQPQYHDELVAAVILLMEKICGHGSRVRLVTVTMCIELLHELLPNVIGSQQRLADDMLALLQGASEASTLQLRLFYKGAQDDIFLDMFEDEFNNVIVDANPLNVEYLMMDASMLLPPTGTPMTGIEFNKRLPCGEVERARRAMQIFFIVRQLWHTLTREIETELPLISGDEAISSNDTLDLNNSDLIACTVMVGERANKQFLVVSPLQLILVEPDKAHLGWGIVQFVAFLQDIEITSDPASSDCIHIVAHHPTAHNSRSATRHKPLLTGKLKFDDHIRCSAARQRIQHGCNHVKFSKMVKIARILQLPSPTSPASLGFGYLAPVTVVHQTAKATTQNKPDGCPGTKSNSFSDLPTQTEDQHPSHKKPRSITMPAVTGEISGEGLSHDIVGTTLQSDTNDNSSSPIQPVADGHRHDVNSQAPTETSQVAADRYEDSSTHHPHCTVHDV